MSSGASVGATAVLLFGAFASLGAWAVSAGSVLGALGAMGAVFLVSRQGRGLSPTQLILCGVVVAALFESVTSSGRDLRGPAGAERQREVHHLQGHLPGTPASGGQVLVDGHDLLALRPRDAARRIAVVAQEFTLEFDFTVAELVMIGRTPHKRAFGRDDETDRAIAEEAIEKTGCQHLAHRGFNTLSGGEKQRVLIAQALAQGAGHLILDEPTSHLDIRYQVEILELVAGLGVTVLAAIHDISLAALFCDTVHLIAGGQLVTGGPPRQVLTAATVRAAYGTEVLVIAHPETGTPHLIPRRTRRTDQPGRQTPRAQDPPDASGN